MWVSARSSKLVTVVSTSTTRVHDRLVPKTSLKTQPTTISDGSTRRELMLYSINTGFLAALFTFGAVERPKGLGIKDYGSGVKSLGLCPATPNCIATSEELDDITHYVPPLLYNPEDGRGRKNPVTQKEAMAELVSVVSKIQPDKFTPTIVANTDDYLYAEFQSPTFGFIDDVEFWFPSDKPGTVEYRSASRIGESDGDINRKRIRAIRKELEKRGWASAGF
eukprot:g1596.t1